MSTLSLDLLLPTLRVSLSCVRNTIFGGYYGLLGIKMHAVYACCIYYNTPVNKLEG